MTSAKNRRLLIQIVPFGVISILFGVIYSLIEQGILGDYPIYPTTGNPYEFNPLASGLLALAPGLMVGAIEVKYINKKFRKSSLTKKIISKTVIYITLITLFSIFISITGHAFALKSSPFDQRVLDFTYKFITSFTFWTIELYMILGIGVCLFYTEVSDNIGQAVLINFFTGKYHKPKQEERVFMFLDMKSSTAIAEKIKHIAYFEMLKDYYADLSEQIIEYDGEIYQYVGDEVVISWKYKPNLMNRDPLDCFFAMKKSLCNQADKYIAKYGVVPTFKAGIHLGSVTTGEIGEIKKEIIFSGDVLNTTARIQELCNSYKVDILISKDYLDVINPEPEFTMKALGDTELRGKMQKVSLYTVEISQL